MLPESMRPNLEFCRDAYSTTQNPAYLWSAVKMCLMHDEPLPGWCKEYLVGVGTEICVQAGFTVRFNTDESCKAKELVREPDLNHQELARRLANILGFKDARTIKRRDRRLELLVEYLEIDRRVKDGDTIDQAIQDIIETMPRLVQGNDGLERIRKSYFKTKNHVKEVSEENPGVSLEELDQLLVPPENW